MIWILIPAFNEEDSILTLLGSISSELSTHKHKIVVVDDGSRDDTPSILEGARKNYPLTIVKHAINRGLGETERDGFEYIAAHCAPEDIIVRVEGDNTHGAAYILKLVDKIYEGFDVVNTSRFQPGGGQVGLDLYRRFISRCANIFMHIVFQIKGVRDYSCGFRAYRGAVLQDAIKIFGNNLIQLKGVGFTSTLEIIVKLKMMGCVFSEVPFILRYDLKKGKSKMLGSVTTVGYLLLGLMYHWPFGGWKFAYRGLKKAYQQNPEQATNNYRVENMQRRFMTRINS